MDQRGSRRSAECECGLDGEPADPAWRPVPAGWADASGWPRGRPAGPAELVVCPRCDRRLLFCPPDPPPERAYAGPIVAGERRRGRGTAPGARGRWPGSVLDALEGEAD
jgi:hypothetical protein